MGDHKSKPAKPANQSLILCQLVISRLAVSRLWSHLDLTSDQRREKRTSLDRTFAYVFEALHDSLLQTDQEQNLG